MIFHILIFLLNPFISIWVLVLDFLKKQEVRLNESNLKYIIIFISIYFGFINSTKFAESDFLFHSSFFLKAKYFNFFDYLKIQGRESVFYTFNYLFYYLTNGNVKLWIFTITSLSYLFYLKGILIFQKNFFNNKHSLLIVILISAFFPQQFSLSAHLIRQFLAGAIIIYVSAIKIIEKKNYYFLALVAVLIHSSSLIFLPLIYLNFLSEKLDRNNYIKYLILSFALIGYQILASTILSLSSVSGNAAYVLERASKNTSIKLESFSFSNYLFILIDIIAVLKYYYSKIINHNFEHFIKMNIILISFILINTNQAELALRLFFYLCFFFPILLNYLLEYKLLQKTRSIIVLIVIFYFFYRIKNGVWAYEKVNNLISWSSFHYLNNFWNK